MKLYNTDNPFYHNYLFSKEDLQRAKINKWRHWPLFFKQTYVQLSDGYEFYYKIHGGQIFLMDIKPLAFMLANEERTETV